MKLRYKILFIAVALIGLSSCKDFLDKVPDTRVYLVNLDQLKQLLVTGYMDANYALVGELSSDNIIDNNSPNTMKGSEGVRYNLSYYSQADEQVFAWQDVDLDISSSDTPSGVWNACYGAIAVANAVLEKINEFEADGMIEGEAITSADQARIDALKGEAYMIRAYHHFILAQIFCMPYRGDNYNATLPGIPYAIHSETELDPKYDRGTLKETYDKIEADLKLGLQYITDEFQEVPKYHFNVASSNAFAARFYLIERQYDKVVEYCNAALKGTDPKTMLNDGWTKDEFYYINDIGRYFTSVDRPGNLQIFTSNSTWWRRFVQSARFACNREAKRGTIQGPGPSWSGCRYRNPTTNEVFAMMPCFNGFCGIAGASEYGAYFAGNSFEQFEYSDKIAGIGYCHAVRPEFTVEEVLLMRAEAYLFLNDIDAAFADLSLWNEEHLTEGAIKDGMKVLSKNDVVGFYSYYDNPTRRDPGYGIVMKFNIDEVCPSDKYHLTNEIEPYLQCVQHFRRIQFVHMGNRWFDIKRYGFSITHKMGISDSYTLEVLDPRYAIQIPNEVVGAGLTPNPRETTTPSDDQTVNSGEYVRVSE